MMYLLETPNYYKIGYANDVEKRMKQYNTDNPEYTLLDTCEGTEEAEKICHRFLKKVLPYKGEWYEKSDMFIPLWEYVKEMTQGMHELKEKYNKDALTWCKRHSEVNLKYEELREEFGKLSSLNEDLIEVLKVTAQSIRELKKLNPEEK